MRHQVAIANMVTLITRELDVITPTVDFDSVWCQPVQDRAAELVSHEGSVLPPRGKIQRYMYGEVGPVARKSPTYRGPLPKLVVFIGGRDVKKNEFRMLKVLWPHVPFIPVVVPGGAAAELP